MNPRKMLALLGPRAPSLKRLMHQAFGLVDGGGGGDPVTAQDVAGALGFIELEDPADRRVAIGLYCLLWFPNYDTKQRRHDITEALALRLGAEYQRRMESGNRGRKGDHAPFPTFPAKRWELKTEGLWAIAAAVLDELQHKHDCEACDGFGQVAEIRRGGWVAKRCEACEGRGYCDWGHERRAKAVQIRRYTYRMLLDRPYRWLLSEARHLEQQAASGHYMALMDD